MSEQIYEHLHERVEALAGHIRVLIAELARLRDTHPEAFYGTPYETLHNSLRSGLETYEHDKYTH